MVCEREKGTMRVIQTEIILIDGYGLCTPDAIRPDTKRVLLRG